MNARELVDHIRSGPATLVLDESLPRFRRRTRSNPCDFNEFIQALQSSETIQRVACFSHQALGITEDEWVLLVKTLGSIKSIKDLWSYCTTGSRDFHPFQAIARAVNHAQSLCEVVVVVDSESSPSDSSGITALASALREHKTLQEFRLLDWSTVEGTALDPVLQALPACPHLNVVAIMTRCASAAAMQNLLQLRPATDLHLALETEQWLAVADEIRQGRCEIKRLTLNMHRRTISEATEALEALASAIKLDYNLTHLTLRMENGFTDEESVALAEALTVNKTLLTITLSAKAAFSENNLPNTVELGVLAYLAFGAMLRVNTNLVLELPPLDDAVSDERIVDSRNQMRIEQRLNNVGRGRLLVPSQTTRVQWVDALHTLSTYDDVNVSPSFDVSCVYSLLRLQPAICMLRVDDSSDSGE
jgi:hypothetical protein